MRLSEKTLEDMLEKSTHHRWFNDTKVLLNYDFEDGSVMDIVFKASQKNKGKILFVVFKREGKRWIRLEEGFHHDVGYIQSYLTRKYLEVGKLRNRKVISYAR